MPLKSTTKRLASGSVIEYHELGRGQVGVYLDKRKVGVISDGRRNKKGWQYSPDGRRGGEFFATLEAVKQSMERE